MTMQTLDKTAKVAMNGVDVPTLSATLGAVEGNRDLAKFTFRATGEWLKGTHSRARMAGYSGAGGHHDRMHAHMIDGDHPAVLCGADNGATPVEMLLAALSACITAGIGNIASMRQVKLHSVETTIEGDIDLQGIFGMDDTVRNGFSAIRATFRIQGDAAPEMLERIVRQAIARSAVFDVLRNGVPITVAAVAA